MKYIEFKTNAEKHLSEWIRAQGRHPEMPEGDFCHNSKIVHHKHILPLEKYKKGERKDAIIETIRKYDVLTDGVELNLNVFPKKELHVLANHLTSSQILCYNFFGLFLKEEMADTRKVIIAPELRRWVQTSFRQLPPISEYAKCVFEYQFDDTEGTSFDFCILDKGVTLLFEIKYTEQGFGKAPNDTRHKDKFSKIYSHMLRAQSTVRKQVQYKDFIKNYQLFRNAIRTGENVYSVVIYPQHNNKCDTEYKDFIRMWADKPERLLSITWEDAFSNSPLISGSELRQKYNL